MFNLKKITTKRIMLTAVLTAGLVMLFSNISFAAVTTAVDKAKSANTETIKNGLAWLKVVQDFLTKAFWPILEMIGHLLDGSVIFGNGMESKLRDIWVQVRNLVNIMFVIALLGVAIYNVFGIGDENGSYSIKSMLPKVIIGIIAVNFSFLGMKIFMDIVNVATVSVFSIASDVNVTGGYDENICYSLSGVDKDKYPKPDQFIEQRELGWYRSAAKEINEANSNCGIDIAASDDIAAIISKISTPRNTNVKDCPGGEFKKKLKEKVDSSKEADICKKSTDGKAIVFNDKGKLKYGEASKFEAGNAAMLMATNLLKVQYYDQVDISIDNYDKLAVGSIFSVVLYIIYAAAFVALFIVLLARMVVLWLAVAFSPILVLSAVVPAVKDKIGDKINEILSNLLAPLIIAVGMTIGWIMLNALKGTDKLVDKYGDVITKTNIIPVVEINGFQDLLIAGGTVAVVWLAVFAGAKGSIAEGAVGMISGGLKQAGKFIATAPLKYGTIIPTNVKDENGKNIDLAPMDLLNIGRRLGGGLNTKASRRVDKFLGERSSGVAALKELKNNTSYKPKDKALELKAILKETDSRKLDTKDAKAHVKDIISDDKVVTGLGGANSPTMVAIDKYLADNGKSKETIKNDNSEKGIMKSKSLKDVRDSIAIKNFDPLKLNSNDLSNYTNKALIEMFGKKVGATLKKAIKDSGITDSNKIDYIEKLIKHKNLQPTTTAGQTALGALKSSDGNRPQKGKKEGDATSDFTSSEDEDKKRVKAIIAATEGSQGTIEDYMAMLKTSQGVDGNEAGYIKAILEKASDDDTLKKSMKLTKK